MAIIEKEEFTFIKQTLLKPQVYILWIISIIPLMYIQASNIEYTLLATLAFCFAIIFVIDLKHYIIPDTLQITIFIIANTLIAYNPLVKFQPAYIGAITAFLIFAAIHYGFEKILKKPGLGFGDVKLFANAGLIIGIFYFNNFLLVLSAVSIPVVIIRALFKDKSKLIPYGPMIVTSIWLCILYQQPINNFIYSTIEKLLHYFI